MSLIPTNNNSNSDSLSLTPFTPFPQHFWDNFFSSPSFPFPFPTQFPSFPFPFPFPGRTVPYSELAVETSGTVRARLECKEVEVAHLMVAEMPGVAKHEVDVTAEEGGFVRISGGDGGGGEEERRFLWRLRLPRDASLGMLSWSMENGVLTVVVPKVDAVCQGGWNFGNSSSGRSNNIRQIEIEGSSD